MQLFFLFLTVLTLATNKSSAQVTCVEKVMVDKIWAGHPVDFDFTTTDSFQYVTYYDSTRTMVISKRVIGSTEWDYHKFATTTGWDSHNYIDLALDDSGYIHVSGNMHNVPLIYFRSTRPYEIDGFTSPGMIGNLENSITYPVFIKGLDGKLFFQYRDGGSGSGTTIWNGYDLHSKRWSRITTSGLFDGQGQVNAYQTVPVPGPDGFFHVIWMWRNTPVANTNHHLSHMKSRDLVNWQTMSGSPLQIPVTQSTTGVVADPIESGNGLINMDFGIGWDLSDRAILTYHRYDNNDVSQIFNTRWDNGTWKIYQTSNWTGFKWDLDRNGSLSHDIAAQPVQIENNQLTQDYIYRDNLNRRWILDENTLTPIDDQIYEAPEAMQEMYTVESTYPNMQINIKKDGNYYLKWETLPINQDQSRSSYPSSAALKIYQYSTATDLSGKNKSNGYKPVFKKTNDKIVISNVYRRDIMKNWSLSIYNTLGRKILSKSSISASDYSVSINNWTKGMYLIKISNNIKEDYYKIRTAKLAVY